MGWESATTVVVTGVAVGDLSRYKYVASNGRMSSLESRVSGIEQRLARIEGCWKATLRAAECLMRIPRLRADNLAQRHSPPNALPRR